MCLLRGDTMRALDGRDAVLFVEVVEERRVASRRPGAGDVGNEQKARIIKEYEMALHFAAFFICGQSCGEPRRARNFCY